MLDTVGNRSLRAQIAAQEAEQGFGADIQRAVDPASEPLPQEVRSELRSPEHKEASPPATSLVRAAAMSKWQRFTRMQDVEADDVWAPGAAAPPHIVALSHRWRSPEHPDPDGLQLREAQRRVATLAAEMAWALDDVGVFYDFCSLPQPPRSEDERAQFAAGLSQLNDLYGGGASRVVVLSEDADDYMERAWCFMEYFLALTSNTLCIQQDQRALENEPMRLLRSRLHVSVEHHGGYGGRDANASAMERLSARDLLLGRLLRTLLATLRVTNGSDKAIIYRSILRYMLRAATSTRKPGGVFARVSTSPELYLAQDSQAALQHYTLGSWRAAHGVVDIRAWAAGARRYPYGGSAYTMSPTLLESFDTSVDVATLLKEQ